jgi:hypothetical protein
MFFTNYLNNINFVFSRLPQKHNRNTISLLSNVQVLNCDAIIILFNLKWGENIFIDCSLLQVHTLTSED